MNIPMQKAQQGFTLIELMIVVAIIGILASVAIPSYQTYTKKAHFSEIIMAASSAKSAVEMCIQLTNSKDNCDSGTNGVPNDVNPTTGQVASVVTSNGVVTVTPRAQNGIAGTDQYILTPDKDADGKVSWAVTGGCLSTGLCQAATAYTGT